MTTTRDYKTCPAVHEAVHALLALLTPVERASLAGSILANAGVEDGTISAFVGELSEDDVAEIVDQIA